MMDTIPRKDRNSQRYSVKTEAICTHYVIDKQENNKIIKTYFTLYAANKKADELNDIEVFDYQEYFNVLYE